NDGAEIASATPSISAPRINRWVRITNPSAKCVNFSTVTPKRRRKVQTPPRPIPGSGLRLFAVSVPEESFDRIDLVGDGRRGKRIKKSPAVPHRPEPRVEHRQHAPVGPVADEPSKALLQSQYGEGHLVLSEGVAAQGIDGLDPGCGDRFGRRRERQLVDD